MTMKVKPNNGLKVRKEDGTHLAKEGETVPRNSFWVRRLNDGDVIDMSPKKKPKAKGETA